VGASGDLPGAIIQRSALLKLGRRDEAAAAVDALTHRFGPAGGLVGGCYNRKKNLAVGHELIWGDYFLLETSIGLRHDLDTTSL
jgi:unsaturated chondroitin disaccharide hydrolase